MNKAQKRTWLSFAISLATILISAVVITYIRQSEINIFDLSKPTRFRILGFSCTIPLILIVILQMRFPKKKYDERDKLIERKANAIGIVGAFIFLGGAAWLLSVMTKMGSIKAPLVTLLVYLACFVWILVSSTAALIQYGWKIKGEKS
jgi:predicted Na+-dependent transporter